MKLTVNTKQFKKAVKNCIDVYTQFFIPVDVEEEGVVLVEHFKNYQR